MKTLRALLAPLPIAVAALAGCTNGQGQVDVTATNVANFPPPPAGLATLAGGQTVSTDGVVVVDFQKDLQSLSELGSLSAEVSQNSVSGQDLSVLQHIQVTIATEDGHMPVVVLSDADVPRDATQMDLPLLIEPSQILAYLAEGKVDVHFYLSGEIPERTLTLTHTLVAHVDVAVKGSVLKF